MLDFGFSEILLTSAIALVVLGPERLPKVARQVGNWMGRARLMARQLSEQLEREVSEVNAAELLKQQINPKLENPVLPPAGAPESPAAPVVPKAPRPLHPNSAAAMHPPAPPPPTPAPGEPTQPT
jgi:sec-independent protein translocase protein TatB